MDPILRFALFVLAIFWILIILSLVGIVIDVSDFKDTTVATSSG